MRGGFCFTKLLVSPKFCIFYIFIYFMKEEGPLALVCFNFTGGLDVISGLTCGEVVKSVVKFMVVMDLLFYNLTVFAFH